MHKSVPFRLSPLILSLAALGLYSSKLAHAADEPTQEELKAQLEKARQEIARLRQELGNGREVPATPAAASPEKPTPAADTPVTPAANAEASATLDTVVVRSRNRLAALQEVPTSVSVVTGTELARLGADSMREISRRAANVTRSNSSNARSSDISIRGIGRKGSSEAQDPNVGLIVDGISYGYAGLSTADLIDVDTVSVIRGPVGTTGGKNASIGTVSITTQAPSFTPSTDVTLRYGQRDAVFGQVAVTGPLVDDLLAYRTTLYYDKVEGLYKNQYNNGDSTYNDRDKISGKFQLLYTPSGTFDARVIAEIHPRTWQNDNGLTFRHDTIPYYSNGSKTNLVSDPSQRLARRWFTQNSNYSYQNDYLNYDSGTQNNDEQRALYTGLRSLSTTLNWKLGDFTVSSITGWNTLYFDARNDEGTPFNISTQGGGGVRYRQFTQELRLTSPKGGKVDYLAGLYLIKNRHEVDSKTGFGSDAGAWFADGTTSKRVAGVSQYAFLDSTGAGRDLLAASLDQVRTSGTAVTENFSPAIYSSADWHLGNGWNLTTGARLTRENRKASNFNSLVNNGKAPELNPTASNTGKALGGFDPYYNNTTSAVSVLNGNKVPTGTTNATVVASGGLALTTSPTSPYYASSLAAADAAAQKYFGQSWNALVASNLDGAKQLASAAMLRKANIGLIYDTVNSEEVSENQYTLNISPSYKISDNVTGYATYQYGEKAPVAQVVNAQSLNALPEKTNNIELGLKTSLFDSKLTLNADVFWSTIRNYQQSARVVDDLATLYSTDGTTQYATLTGNAPKVKVRGLEFDGVYTGIQRTTLRFSGAYNIAKYAVFPQAPQPAESNYSGAPPFADESGQFLPGAAKFTANAGAEYRLPLSDNLEVIFDGNDAYTTGYNIDTALSVYGRVQPYHVFDLGLGLGRRDRAWNVTLLVKNATNELAKNYGFSSGTNEVNPRWIGVGFNAHL